MNGKAAKVPERVFKLQSSFSKLTRRAVIYGAAWVPLSNRQQSDSQSVFHTTGVPVSEQIFTDQTSEEGNNWIYLNTDNSLNICE